MKRIPKDFKTRPILTRRERDTVLAALRRWQSRNDGKITQRMAMGIATDFGPSLTSREIDDLCDRLNFRSHD